MSEQTYCPIAHDKTLRKNLDGVLQDLKRGTTCHRSSRERSIATTKIQEAIMWLGMDLKAIREETGEGESPYPESYNPDSKVIEPPADGMKM